jgi:hypothetical protein
MPSHNIITTNPDPTEAVKETLTLAIKNLDDKISQRQDISDKAVVLAREELQKQLTAMNENISGKFLANKDLVDQLGTANAAALAAALLTRKEIADKSEASIAETFKTTNEKIDRLTSRQDTGEGRTRSNIETKQDQYSDKSQFLFIISLAIALGGLLFGIFKHG